MARSSAWPDDSGTGRRFGSRRRGRPGSSQPSLAAGRTIDDISAIDEELTLDGVDEMLRLFLEFDSVTCPEDYGTLLEAPDERHVGLSAGGAHWTLHATPKGIRVADSGMGEAADWAGRVSGSPAHLLLWLWNRAGAEAVSASGDAGLLAQFAQLRKAATQSLQSPPPACRTGGR